MTENTNTGREPSKRKISFPTIILIYALAASLTSFSSYSLAKWQSAAEGADLAHIAAFAADAQGQANNTLTIDCDAGITSADYVITVANHENGVTAQVAVEYIIIIILPRELPEGVTLTVDGITPSVSTDQKTYTFTNADWNFPASVTSTDNHTLTVFADPDIVLSDFTMNNIHVNVITRQID